MMICRSEWDDPKLIGVTTGAASAGTASSTHGCGRTESTRVPPTRVADRSQTAIGRNRVSAHRLRDPADSTISVHPAFATGLSRSMRERWSSDSSAAELVGDRGVRLSGRGPQGLVVGGLLSLRRL